MYWSEPARDGIKELHKVKGVSEKRTKNMKKEDLLLCIYIRFFYSQNTHLALYTFLIPSLGPVHCNLKITEAF